ncbi:vacuolar protein sorting/targeting protein PEP1 [Plenodomus lingam]|uniref:Vacuolar protein sorting/targeting protein 10 n=1 Tax=Leptosphaeria maculans (strain JN3 / isolate v23.1.3 / race Av1-4-5-6-7-8) TaxID=985895 RepID=VPS10_LEPMJ|nr:RecName: Full=Vacuolar protein sorting/targeting protein 10; AltName: Full=Carboxypeptidase Y receptor; Short=CPY receptor; AltName: Full=Sortilin VPS10; AltName: Full=Vacuolar carboxypeptidase sorting receptor VPS10; Flags: Precursor [Plenodomus lingam JN3]KAH9873953.1 vacuolar protein sorting/targeting protein PEP1 [Plenodomus lingam]
MKYLRGLLLPALLALAPSIAAKKDEPLIETTAFKNDLINLMYFDDSGVALVQEIENGNVWRSHDAGKGWSQIKDVSKVLRITKSPYDNKAAIVLGEKKHWITYDRGENWDSFETEFPPSPVAPVGWHASDNKKILVNEIEDCFLAPCLGRTYYTTDGFKSKPKVLVEDRRMCQWAKGSERFLEGEDKHDSRILCITRGKYSDRSKDFRLLISDNFFKDSEEPKMSSGRTVQGMTNMAAVKGYIVVASKPDHSNELSLYTTQDTETWHHAQFGDHKIEEDAYTILESTNYSIQVDVMTSKYVDMGNMYTSNSRGTYFTKNVEHTNRNQDGFVDFEKIANIQGVVLVNTVDNWKEYEKSGQNKKLKSRISFDDGRSFEKLTVKGKDDELHLHSVTNLHNSGRVFSSPAPGIVMGVGNTGEHLGKYTDGDLYVSDDAGLTWEMALSEAHKYEFGDQGSVLVAVFDEGDTDEIRYSFKHGRKDSWKKIKLDYKIRARELTTLPDATSLKFMMYASRKKEGGGREHVIIHLDFADMLPKCEDKDFDDKWSVRQETDGKPSCVMGHKQLFRRRKWDAECFIGDVFNDPVPTFEPCDCDEIRDYECDFGFDPSGEGKDKKCVPSDSRKLPEGACEGDAKTFKDKSGWRKIPGNQCKGETDREKEVERPCGDAEKQPPKSNKITSELTKFKGGNFQEYYYLERNAQADDDKPNDRDKDETVVMLTDERTAWITHDHGKKWKKAVDDEIVRIYPHQYENNYVYFLTATKKVYYSEDRGLHDSIHSFQAPTMPNTERLEIMRFHPNQKGWLIWMGGKNCEKVGDKDCHTVSYISQKNGQEESWEPMVPYVKKCVFIWREAGRKVKEEQVFCEQYTNEEMGAPLQLISSDDWFKKKEVKFKSVVEFATMAEFIVVATKADDGTLHLDATLDGSTFAEAKFPPKFFDVHQTAYTVLDSSTHAVFLHVTVNPQRDQEYGSIIKSNSNGTSYVMSLSGVNRNTEGYVDFEKMQGLEGVAVANIVANVDEVNNGTKKRKQSRITHNDGAAWEPLQAPEKDSEDQPYKCDVSDKEKCSLHIHGYTERADPREMYSSPTAVGMMLAVGNVGSELTTFGEASTFMTIDAGITWKEIKKGTYAWEFGDQGAIIAIVRRGEDTDHIYYSLDYGEKWNLYKFSEHKIRVDAITTVPSDTSLNFLLWGKDSKELVAVNIDFSGLPDFKRKCEIDEDNPTAGDFDLWSPQHPLQDGDQDCLFGHVAQYHRKKRGAQCKTQQRIDHMHNIARNCTCTRRDYECAYNYERKPGGECEKIPGLELADPKEVCSKGAKEWWDPSPYRKIPLSTCQGKEMDQIGEVHACPGFEEEFEKKHGLSGFGIFLAVVLPFLAAGGIGYYVWRNWDGKFGRIRLGENGGSFDSDAAWVKWPVAAVSGLVAVVTAIPLVMGSLWNFLASRMGGGYGGRTYTSRSSFARGRGDYAVVDPDEGELLGEESDEEV